MRSKEIMEAAENPSEETRRVSREVIKQGRVFEHMMATYTEICKNISTSEDLMEAQTMLHVVSAVTMAKAADKDRNKHVGGTQSLPKRSGNKRKHIRKRRAGDSKKRQSKR